MRYSPGGETMTNERYEALKLKRFEERTKMASGKANEYAKDDDRLANFKEIAAALGIEPLTVAGVYWYKHVSAMLTFIRKNQQKADHKLSEPIEGRIQDDQEYLDLIAALIDEFELYKNN
jgi:hypothetical protein